jgi:hypothetical protein
VCKLCLVSSYYNMTFEVTHLTTLHTTGHHVCLLLYTTQGAGKTTTVAKFAHYYQVYTIALLNHMMNSLSTVYIVCYSNCTQSAACISMKYIQRAWRYFRL